MSDHDRHLAALPADVRELIASPRSPSDTAIALVKAFALLGLPRAARDPTFPRPSELTKAQRALAEIVAERGIHGVVGPMPGGAAARRWLGLDPPGAFERDIVWRGERLPLWLVLQRERDKDQDAVLLSLPPAERIEAIATFEDAWDYELGQSVAWTWGTDALKAVKDECGAWASSVLDASENDDPWRMHREHIAFLAAVRAGVAIRPRWDRFFPIGSSVPESIAAECAPALSLERMEATAVTLLGTTHGHRAIRTALALLRHHDSPAIARFVLEKSEKSLPHNRREERATLAEIATTKPGVAAVLGKRPAGPVRSLVVTARLAPKGAGDLTPLQTKQLVEAGRRWDGKKLPASRRLSLDENDEAALGAVLEHVTLSERGRPAFDAWLFMSDSGAFFATGTTKVVAERREGAVILEGKADRALSDALSEAGESKAAVRPTAAVRAATSAGAAKAKAKTKTKTKTIGRAPED